MLLKKDFIISQKLGSRDFWQIANSVLNKGKSAIALLFNRLEVLPSESDKAKLFAENVSGLLELWHFIYPRLLTGFIACWSYSQT